LRPPLKHLVYEKVKQQKHMLDTDLLAELNRENLEVSMRELNKVLLHLEILGKLTVRWVGKEKRRIESKEKYPEES